MRHTIGRQYRFMYPDAFVTLEDYTAHAGQVVTIIRELSADECDPENAPMYQIQAADGWVGSAFSDELEEQR